MIIEANVDNTLPSVIFDEVKGKIEIKGRSVATAPEEFYTELIGYIDVYTNYPSDLELTIDLEYFNTPTAMCLISLFKSLYDDSLNPFSKYVLKFSTIFISFSYLFFYRHYKYNTIN